jgi:transcriptional antiterminator NusG
MNMQYRKGQIVGYVERGWRGPLETPIPQRWYVLRTFPNKEPKVLRTYRNRNISFYFPTIRNRKRVTCTRKGYTYDVIRDVISPLFSGIIFIPDFQAHEGGVHVDGVEGYFKMGDCYPYLTPKLFNDVRRLEADGNIPAARKRRLYTIGQRVNVVDGPFAAFNGIVDRLDSDGRLKVLVEIFGRWSSVLLDEDQIEAA